jgi:hypothetical protein
MAFILNDGAVVPASVYSAMNTVLNKKLGTSQVYPPRDWAAIVRDLVPLPIKSASGSIAHFSDGADTVPLKSLAYTLTPTQAGTGDPSPSNPRPINSVSSLELVHTGANFWNENWEVGTINDTTGQPNSSTTQIRSVDFCPCKGGLTYYIKVGSNNPIRVFWYDENKTFISQTINIQNSTATAPDNAHYLKIRGTNAYGTTYQDDISINYPSTNTSYHAHVTPTTHTVNLGGVYGGTGNEAGEFEKKWSDPLYIDGSTQVNAVSQSGGTYFVTVVVNLDSKNTTSSNKTVYSDKFVTRTGLGGGDDHCCITNSGKTLVCVLADQNITTKAQATQWFADHPTTFVYELATPNTLSVDPVAISSRLGENNIFADVGGSNIEVEYYADPTLATQ